MNLKSTDYCEIDNYWIGKKQYCMTFFNKAVKVGKKVVIAKYGQKNGSRILERVKQEYVNFLPEVPYVGEIDVMQRQMLLTVVFTSFYKVLKEDEKIIDIWVLCNNFKYIS